MSLELCHPISRGRNPVSLSVLGGRLRIGGRRRGSCAFHVLVRAGGIACTGKPDASSTYFSINDVVCCSLVHACMYTYMYTYTYIYRTLNSAPSDQVLSEKSTIHPCPQSFRLDVTTKCDAVSPKPRTRNAQSKLLQAWP